MASEGEGKGKNWWAGGGRREREVRVDFEKGERGKEAYWMWERTQEIVLISNFELVFCEKSEFSATKKKKQKCFSI